MYLLIHRSRSEVVHYHPIDFHGWARGLQLQLRIELRLVLHLRNGLKSQPTLRVSIEFQYLKQNRKITYLVDVRALSLTHLNKMIYKQFAIIPSNSSSFFKTLIGIKRQLFSL